MKKSKKKGKRRKERERGSRRLVLYEVMGWEIALVWNYGLLFFLALYIGQGQGR